MYSIIALPRSLPASRQHRGFSLIHTLCGSFDNMNVASMHASYYLLSLSSHPPQGEMVDLIEHNVESAAVYVQSGQRSLKIAATLKPKIRRVSIRH